MAITLSTSPTFVDSGFVQVLRNHREIMVNNKVAAIEPIGLRTHGYSLLIRIEKSGQAENKTKDAMANMRCHSEDESWLGVVK